MFTIDLSGYTNRMKSSRPLLPYEDILKLQKELGRGGGGGNRGIVICRFPELEESSSR